MEWTFPQAGFSDIKTKIQMPVTSIAQGAENMENAVKLLDFIYKQR